MSLARIQQILIRAGAKQIEPGLAVWHLAAPWWFFARRARRIRGWHEEILAALLELPGPHYLVIDENPQAHDVGGHWAHAGSDTWLVPASSTSARRLARALARGDWSAYRAMEPATEPLPDCFGVGVRQIVDFARAHAISVLVQSAAGNDPWRLYLESVSSRHRIAA